MINDQFLVDAILVRSKRGPYNKISKMKRLQKVKELYFDKEHTVIDIANSLGIHRNTISSDVEYLRNDFLKNGGQNEMIDFFYRKKLIFARQKTRLEEKIRSSPEEQIRLEKLLLDLAEKEFKLFSKFIPTGITPSRPDKKTVEKIIRELAFDGFAFFREQDLVREIIRKTKCTVDTAYSIISEMEPLGLSFTATMGSQITLMTEFAQLCGYISEEEVLGIKQEKAQREEQEEFEYKKRLLEFNKEFEEKHGDSKDWSAKVLEKYNHEKVRLG